MGVDRIVPADHRDLPPRPDEFFFHDILDAELKESLEKLPKHYLEVILLVDMEELSYREAADVLNIPTGTIMSRLHRARKILQAQLQELARKKGIVKTRVQPMFEEKDTDTRGGTRYGT